MTQRVLNLVLLIAGALLLMAGPVLLLVFMDESWGWWTSLALVVTGALALFFGMRSQERQAPRE